MQQKVRKAGHRNKRYACRKREKNGEGGVIGWHTSDNGW